MNVSVFQFVSISADLLHLSKYLLLKISSILCDFVGFFFFLYLRSWDSGKPEPCAALFGHCQFLQSAL